MDPAPRPLEKDKQTLENITAVDYTLPEIDPALDRAITRKFDTHLLPWLFGLWLLAFIDRSNIGNARIDGLANDLKLETGNKFNIVGLSALCVFYIPYILVDVPSNWVLKYFGAGRYLPALMLGWGFVGLCTGFTKSYGFYRRHNLLFRMGLFYCASPLSGAFGGLLATGLAEIRFNGYNPFFLPDSPSHSKFLTEEERIGALRRLMLDARGANSTSDVDHEAFSWHWVRLAVFNVNTLLLSLDFFAIITPIYSFSLFLPTIIRAFGYTNVKAQLFTVPPNMVGFFAVIGGTFLSDRIKARGPVMLFCCSLAIIGYIILLVPARPAVHYGGTFFIAAGVFPSAPAVMGWLANNLAPHYTRGTGTGLQIAIANCSAFIATFTYVTKDAPNFRTGHSINIGMLVLSLCLTTCTMIYVKLENGKRARGERDYLLHEGDEKLLGHRHPSFRYTI
ncbi:hypothetical protein MMC29_000971 [Sticta canariensis]|nr:hypothetical protein [Sticta canariensis]